ncbi:MAG: hypothetical protein ABH850_02155 [Candidatus Micrarchaeota archaeon]
MVKTKGVIREAKIYGVYDLFRRKPRGLGFNDTDVIVVKAKTKKGNEEVQVNFFTCLKGNGTFSLNAPSTLSTASRERLARFLTYYNLTDKPEEYNLVKNIKKWKNKEVEIVKEKGEQYIFVP